MLPTSYVSEQDIEYLYVKDIFDKRLQLNATEDVIDNIYKTYKGELESMTLEQSSKDRILGYLSVEEKLRKIIIRQRIFRFMKVLQRQESFWKMQDSL